MINTLKGKHICFDELKLDFTQKQVSIFKDMYEEGYSTTSIARRMCIKTAEVELLMIDLFLRGELQEREGGTAGTKVYVPKNRKEKIIIEV